MGLTFCDGTNLRVDERESKKEPSRVSEGASKVCPLSKSAQGDARSQKSAYLLTRPPRGAFSSQGSRMKPDPGSKKNMFYSHLQPQGECPIILLMRPGRRNPMLWRNLGGEGAGLKTKAGMPGRRARWQRERHRAVH